MALSSSSPSLRPFNSFSSSPRFALDFFNGTLPRPLCFNAALTAASPARLVFVRCGKRDADPVDFALVGDESASKGLVNFDQVAVGSVTDSSSTSSAIDFLTLCHRLKTTKRKGWINHGIQGPESIADHMYLMSLMALIASDFPGLNRERCIKIAIVHDIAEDGVPKAEKSRLEQAALNEMCQLLGGGMRAEEIQELWAEYENNSSLEANLVKDFDKVEMILQALEYETEHGKVLDEFFLYTTDLVFLLKLTSAAQLFPSSVWNFPASREATVLT